MTRRPQPRFGRSRPPNVPTSSPAAAQCCRWSGLRDVDTARLLAHIDCRDRTKRTEVDIRPFPGRIHRLDSDEGVPIMRKCRARHLPPGRDPCDLLPDSEVDHGCRLATRVRADEQLPSCDAARL